jgi:TatD DNase family protein
MKTTYIDTHCHLNFKRFKKTREQVIFDAQNKGTLIMIVPGTDIPLSQKAVEVASCNEYIYAAVGIHPHHTINSLKLKSESSKISQLDVDIRELEKLIVHPKVVAVGEVGLDRHVYEETKYEDYQISAEFMEEQKKYLIAQIRLAKQYQKALIIHNRETKKELFTILDNEWYEDMRFHSVFHCCEPDQELLTYAQIHNIFVGVDGDVTYGGEKAEFAKKIPLEMLVLETDSPFLLPEPLKTQKLYPNTPANIPLIAQCIADLKGVSVEEVAEATTRNAKRLFNLVAI